MAHYVISGKQLGMSIASIALFVTVCAGAGVSAINYFEIPEVQLDADGKCLKVINFKNGDGFVCQDQNVTLRKYRFAK